MRTPNMSLNDFFKKYKTQLILLRESNFENTGDVSILDMANIDLEDGGDDETNTPDEIGETPSKSQKIPTDLNKLAEQFKNVHDQSYKTFESQSKIILLLKKNIHNQIGIETTQGEIIEYLLRYKKCIEINVLSQHNIDKYVHLISAAGVETQREFEHYKNSEELLKGKLILYTFGNDDKQKIENLKILNILKEDGKKDYEKFNLFNYCLMVLRELADLESIQTYNFSIKKQQTIETLQKMKINIIQYKSEHDSDIEFLKDFFIEIDQPTDDNQTISKYVSLKEHIGEYNINKKMIILYLNINPYFSKKIEVLTIFDFLKELFDELYFDDTLKIQDKKEFKTQLTDIINTKKSLLTWIVDYYNKKYKEKEVLLYDFTSNGLLTKFEEYKIENTEKEKKEIEHITFFIKSRNLV